MTASPEVSGLMPAGPESIRLAAREYLAGNLIILPTETVYGVAARPDSEAAMQRLYAAKGRDATKRVAFLAASVGDVKRAGAVLSPVAVRLAEAFWPGPLTMVLPNVRGGWDGFRVPDHPVALAWLRELPMPAAVTSANRSGEPPALTAQEAWTALGNHAALALDAGPVAGGQASTVVRVEADLLVVLRPGPVSIGMLEKTAGCPVRKGGSAV